MTFRINDRLRLDVCWHRPLGLLVGIIAGPDWPWRAYCSTHILSLHIGLGFLSLWREPSSERGYDDLYTLQD